MEKIYKYYILVFSLLLAFQSLNAQEVAISEKLNIRNYFSYDLIGKVNDRVLVYRDKGFTKEVDVYNLDMEHTQYSEFIFEKKKSDIYTLIGRDTAFHVIYGFVEKDSLVVKMREYDHLVRLQDSTTLSKIYKKDIRKRFSYFHSEDKSKTLFLSQDAEQNYWFLVYDAYQKKFTYNNKIAFDDNYTQSFEQIIVTNAGDIIMFKKPDDLKFQQIKFVVLYANRRQDAEVSLIFNEKNYNYYFVDFDNKNSNLVICGNYSLKLGKESKGVYIFKKNINALASAGEAPGFFPYNANLSKELLQGKRRNKKRILDDLLVKDIIFRNDGGIILISEIMKEYSRRSPYNSTFNSRNASPYNRRGWIDYYNDDIVIKNFDNDLNLDWSKVLYKKQFSQDDDAIYSSFFIMKTPTRLRFIYNDEIKNNSTVSEYLMDPAGRIARNSLLSTEYQNMRLRFKDALQLSSNSILVPSEKNYDLNLVKITY